MNKYESTIIIFNRKYKIQVLADDLDSAELQIEECLSVFNRINFYGKIEFDKRYFNCILNGTSLPKEMKHLNLYFSTKSIKKILEDAKQREESLNRIKEENFNKKRINFYNKDSNTFSKVIHTFFTVLFLPILLAIKTIKDFFIIMMETTFFKNGIIELYKNSKNNYKKNLKKQIIKQTKKNNNKRFKLLLLVIIFINILAFNVLGLYMCVPIFIILIIYLTILYKLKRGNK